MMEGLEAGSSGGAGRSTTTGRRGETGAYVGSSGLGLVRGGRRAGKVGRWEVARS